MKSDDDKKKKGVEGPSNGETDGLDFERLRLSQDFAASIGVKREVLTVGVRKPDRLWWIQTHPDEERRFTTAVLHLKEDREMYLVDRELWGDLAGEIMPVVLILTVNRQGVVFFWPIRMPGEDGRLDQWNRSALAAADLAKTKWVRVASNLGLGAYDVFSATNELPPPVWPEMTLDALLRVAFRDRFVDRRDHPVLRKLRGEI